MQQIKTKKYPKETKAKKLFFYISGSDIIHKKHMKQIKITFR